jgi:hypothetical protein
MRSDVIGDFQEPYGAVLVKRADMTALVSRNETLWKVFPIFGRDFIPAA